jgi:hypothetical protein
MRGCGGGETIRLTCANTGYTGYPGGVSFEKILRLWSIVVAGYVYTWLFCHFTCNGWSMR